MRSWFSLVTLSLLILGGASCGTDPQVTCTVSATGDSLETFSAATQTVNLGSSATFTVTANSGYGVSNTVTGTCPAGTWNGAVYTSGAVTSDCSLVFSAVQQFAVTLATASGQTVTPASPAIVNSGSAVALTVNPSVNNANKLSVVTSCPAGSWAGSVYTTGAITSNCSITFSQLPAYSLGFIAGSSGPLNLSSIFNHIGLYTDGTSFSASGGFDNGGAAYSATCVVPGARTFNAIPFNIAAANSANFFSNTTGVQLNVPSGNYSHLYLLGGGVNGATSSAVILNYTDGTSQSVAQTFSDWAILTAQTNQTTALTCGSRNTNTGGSQATSAYVLYFSIPVDSTRVLQSFQTPTSVNVQLMGMTLQ